MTPEQKAAYVFAQAVAAHIESLAMIAANTERESQGMALAYDETAFAGLIDRYGLGHNNIVSFFAR
jgi:hypothetical protein